MMSAATAVNTTWIKPTMTDARLLFWKTWWDTVMELFSVASSYYCTPGGTTHLEIGLFKDHVSIEHNGINASKLLEEHEGNSNKKRPINGWVPEIRHVQTRVLVRHKSRLLCRSVINSNTSFMDHKETSTCWSALDSICRYSHSWSTSGPRRKRSADKASALWFWLMRYRGVSGMKTINTAMMTGGTEQSTASQRHSRNIPAGDHQTLLQTLRHT